MTRIPPYPEEFEVFIKDTLQYAKENQIKIKFSNSRLVYAKNDNSGSSGFFSSEERVLACSIKSEKWLELFIHESCHMKQFIEDSFNWEKKSVFYNYFFSWIEKDLELNEKELNECVKGVIGLELDCEKRSVKIIKEYELPINKIEYIKRANSYLYGILYMTSKRKWLNKLYDEQEIWSIAPKTFKKSYDLIPENLYRAFERSNS